MELETRRAMRDAVHSHKVVLSIFDPDSKTAPFADEVRNQTPQNMPNVHVVLEERPKVVEQVGRTKGTDMRLVAV